MQFIYVAGLEHSGTTLISELLAQQPQVLALGEVGNYFSPWHMRAYLDKWGKYPDARLCSCGAPWEKCEFWGELIHLSGEHSNGPIEGKYTELLQFIRKELSDVKAVVDSTKNTEALKSIMSVDDKIVGDLEIILAAKDARAFAASIKRKTGKLSVLSAYRSMNWWHGVNKAVLEVAEQYGKRARVALYEKVCDDPERVVNALLGSNVSSKASMNIAGVKHAGSHIVLGNKNYLNQNRARVRYDSAWFTDDTLSWAYLANRKARALNHWFYDNAV